MTHAPGIAAPDVRSVMTPRPYTVGPDTGFQEIAALLARQAISAVPVVDAEGHVLGVVSEADLLHRQERAGRDTRRVRFGGRAVRERLRKASGTCARELMTAPALTVDAAQPVPVAARELSRSGVRRVFVVSGGRLVGVLARRDLLRGYLRSDEEVRRDIAVEVFGRALWVQPDTVGIAVEHGVVTLLGRMERRSDAARAGRLAAAVPGVLEVRNRLGYVWDDQPDRRHSRARS
ncbi:BON domain-containing protein [Prauserella shujinwangii]|uniref:BON domain-containing protein n=1 Tax=Prauserella shujinwangii TaxID=1453103 RepID=A0A2T0LQU0_9PSEU|nr:CBS domain-containing protein [Prauserella shujinwangii]PRX45857.1 BON domain-containing protein [Prauserella shujinwangii]